MAHAIDGVTTRRSTRYFVASIALLVVVIGLYAVSTARRTQDELRVQLEDKARAIADAVEAASANAVRGHALVERMITERLMDNARMIDALLSRPMPPDFLRVVAERNGLRRVDLVDLDGKPWTPPTPPFGMPGMGPLAPSRPLMMPFMWGPRWQRPHETPAGDVTPPVVRERKFWDGSVFGVAIGATSFRGVIAVHADAGYVLNFRREVGVDRLLADLGRRTDVADVRLLATDFTVLAASDPTTIGRRAPLDASIAPGSNGVRLVGHEFGPRYEIVRPLALDGRPAGWLLVAFSTEPMTRAWQRDVRAGVLLGAATLGLGGVGLALVFWVQQRHLADVARLETELVRRQRLAALGDVAAAFAHEVRNPLNAVSMGLQRLRAEFAPAPADEYERFVALMQGEVRRLNTIVEQFLALARPLPLTPATFALDTVLHEIADLVAPQARHAGVTVRVAIAGVLPAVTADRDHVKQVVLNLVLNAVQAIGGEGTVTIGAVSVRDAVVITVEDTGPGVAAEVRGRIFDPYFTTKRSGVGLGLTIARRIAEAHGGRLDLEDRPGPGACFAFTLPLATP
jgi:signal transduction histidine kinase